MMFLAFVTTIASATLTSTTLISATDLYANSEIKKSSNDVPRIPFSDSELRLPTDAFVEIQGHTIGDEHRSEFSSKQFFNSIDKNRDGKLGQSELSQFLMNHIGGTTLDTAAEAQSEAEGILHRLDRNNDDSLDSKDVLRYWQSLDNLLTVDEVAEWVVHSVQLPVEIGEIFRQNHVTGYDFPELVDNDGKALLDELNIQKASFRKKIVRLVNALMVGIGSKPNAPYGVKIHLEGCSTAILKWKKPESKGFPVHKFRVQRRRFSSSDNIPVPFNKGNADNQEDARINDTCLSNHDGGMFSGGDDYTAKSSSGQQTCPSAVTLVKPSNTEKIIKRPTTLDSLRWQDICDSSVPECHDFGMQRGNKGYQYRIQAWNAIGKSDWVLVEVKSWGRNRCDTTEKMEKSSETSQVFSIFQWFNFVWSLLFRLSNIVMGALGMIAAISKVKRACTSTSATSTIEPLFPWLLKAVNTLVKAVIGVDVMPHSNVSIENENLANNTYDATVGMVGLMGYKPLSTKASTIRSPPTKALSIRSLSECRSDQSVTEFKSPTVKPKQEEKLSFRRPPSALKTSHKIDREENIRNDSSAKSFISDLPSAMDNGNSKDNHNTPVPSSFDRYSIASNDTLDDTHDNHCNICKKKYKFGKRKKHHCSVCYSTFCHKHGKTTHSNMIPCKVPGDCVCNNCIDSNS